MNICRIKVLCIIFCAAAFLFPSVVDGSAPDSLYLDSLSPYDGFCLVRKANSPDGKKLSYQEAVSCNELVPKHTKAGYFRTSSKGRYRTFSEDGSLYLVKDGQDTLCIAGEGIADGGIAGGGSAVVYGCSVSRHEFNTDIGVFFSPDSSRIAFYRNDESAVAEFPFLNISRPGGALRSVRYPMNGGPSEKLSLGVYDIKSDRTVFLKTDGEFSSEEYYLTNVTWGRDNATIYIQMLDRNQQNMHLNSYNAISGDKKATLLTEHSDTWVEPQYPLHWIKGKENLCIYSTDNRDGFWNLYVLDTVSGQVRRLAAVNADMRYVANDGKYVYFMASDAHPVNKYLWRANLKTGKVEQLTKEPGWHSVEMSGDCTRFVDVYEALDKAPLSTLRDTGSGRVIETLVESSDPTTPWAFTEIEMGTMPTANGNDTNYYRLVKPLNFDPSGKYPLILYVYGGPHSQLVTNTFLGGLRRWELLMAQRGYAVLVMDNRGTQGHGTAYEHCIYGQCGQNEMADQMKAIQMLKRLPWVDNDRIGVYGWSYGGFMSLSLSTNHSDTFKVCVAGGPVIDWRWYEVMYGERYMGRHQQNPEGFEKTSLMNKAKDVRAKTLVIEGAMDDTVVPLNALSFIQKCIDNGVQIEYFTYPVAPHNMRGQDRVHLMEKITDFFVENL